jgi:integrase
MGLTLQHIQHHAGGRKSYRRQFSSDVQKVVGRTQHRVSLGLEGSPGFLSRYAQAAEQYDNEVAKARRKLAGAYDPLDPPTIAYLAEAFRVEALAADDLARWDEGEKQLFKDVAADLGARGIAYQSPWLGQEAERWASKTRETLEAFLPSYVAMRAKGDMDGIVAFWQEEALILAEAQGLVIDPEDHSAIASLCKAVNEAAISSGKDRLARLDGEVVPTPREPISPAMAREALKAPPAVSILASYDRYAVVQKLSAGVRVEWRRYIAHFIRFVGSDDAATLTFAQVQDWRDHLLRTPGTRGPRKPVTVRDKYLVPLRATLAWAVEERLLPENVAQAVKVRVAKSLKLREPDFTAGEAVAILQATLIPASHRMGEGHRLARRWVPWLCAYSGARVNEISQLRAEDVRQVDGIWIMNITPEAGTVKNREAREVPLHAHVIEQGFLAVVKAKGEGPLFYNPDSRRAGGDHNRHFKKVGERLARWVREDVKLTDPSIKPNHAWRHLFKTTCREVVIEEQVADAIVAHAPVSTGRRYGHVTLRTKAEAIARFPRYENAATPLCQT